VKMPFPGQSLPAEGLDAVISVASASGATARIGIRHARAGELVDAYPAGTHDRELIVEGDPTPSAVSEVTYQVFGEDSRCRRVVMPVPEGDIEAIGWAEDAGFRYVVDVQTRSGDYSLLVAEPEWVLAQPHILGDIPLKE
jgi:hypothetical protein